MSVTKPIVLDETGKSIVNELHEIAEKLEKGQGTIDYKLLINKPKINDITLDDNISSKTLHIQDELVSGLNIKTINGESLLGSGNVDINSGEWGKISGSIEDQTDLMNQLNSKTSIQYVDNKVQEEKEHTDGKANYLYYDQFGTIDPDAKEVWYLMSSDKTSPIAGPYELGSGGGGGGTITEMTLEPVKIPKIISGTASECPVTFKWTSTKGTNKVPTGNGTAFFFVNDVLLKTVPNTPLGEVTIDIIDIMRLSSLSSTEITLKLVDAYNNFLLIKFAIATVAIELKSSFVDDTPFKTVVDYTCIPVGRDLKKTLYFYVDNELYDTLEWEKSNEQLTHVLNIPEHGSHSLRVYFSCLIDGEEVISNELYYDLMIEVEGDTTPIIASTFNKFEQEQYIAFTIPYRVYTPNLTYSDIDLIVNDEIINHLTVNTDMQLWEYRADEDGEFELKIKCQDVEKIFNIHVKESTIHIDPVTSNLALYLNATGRSNAEDPVERLKWEYKYTDLYGREQVISADLQHFNFASDGWLPDESGNTILRVAGDARVTIPYKIFERDFRQTGKTIEVEFSTSSVMDYESQIISCVSPSGGKDIGLKITALEAIFTSALSEVSSQYKEEDHIRIAFTVDKINERRLLLMYLDGILCGAMRYPESDSFNQPSPVDITIGSNSATTNIYCIRVYDNNLTMQLIVNNWIADTLNGDLRRERWLRNNNFNSSGEIVMDKLPSNLPYIIWDIDPLPQFKGDKRKGQAYYTDTNDSSKSFHLPVVDGVPQGEYNVQGTSSAAYPIKNIRLKSKSGFIDNDGNVNDLFYITEGGIGANYFTYKVDFASSEGANNVELTRLYNDVAKEAGILTPPQKIDSRVRVGIDGFPIVAFHRDSQRQDSFSTKANFNNDKANEDVYGFVDGDESWEITNNSADEANFKLPATPETFSKAFEIRFPDEDGYSDLTKLQPMTEWVVSTDPMQATDKELDLPILFKYTNVVRSEDGTYSRIEITTPVFTTDSAEYRQSKFKAELKNWFDVDSTIFYYIFTHLFLMIDSRAKNAFPTYYASRLPGDGGNRWYWLPYDMDTAIGIDNEGKLKFNYNLEDTDKIEGADVYNGQNSVIWNNLRVMFDGEIGEMYSGLRATGKLLSFDNIERRFEEHQSKWSENIFNKDSEIKYIDTLTDSDNYLEMLQGNKAGQRKWWLYNRFRYFDSKYLAGDAKSDILQFRAYGKADITVTPFADVYVTVSYANSADAVVSVRAEKDRSYTLPNPLPSSASDQETYIYSASLLKSVGDLSPFKPDTVKAGAATRLQELKVGDASESYSNPNLKELTLGNNTLLKTLDVRNCVNLQQVIDLSNCTGIEEIYTEGTKIGGVTLPTAGVLKILHLPGTITSLIVRNQPSLYDLKIENKENLSLTKLWMENVSGSIYDVYELIRGMESGYNIRLIGIEEDVQDVEEIKQIYNLFDRMHGLDARGEQVDKAQVNGKIHIPFISYADYAELISRYPDIKINADVMQCTVKFFNEGEQYGETQLIFAGYPASKPVPDPTKPSSEELDFIFDGWDLDFSNVQKDMNINALYTSKERIYEIRFDTRTPHVEVPSQFLRYRERVTKPVDPVRPSARFQGWYTEPNYINIYDFSKPVEFEFTLYAKWEDTDVPLVSISRVSYNRFSFTITDNISITAYAITNSNKEPRADEWIEIAPVTPYEGNKIIEYPADYYVWARDIAGHVVNNYIKAYSVNIQEAAGTDISIISAGTEVNYYALLGTVITINATLDPHYSSMALYYNDVEINPGSQTEVNENIVCRTESVPIVYLVLFDIGEYGVKPEDLNVVYGQHAAQPENQFVQQRIIEGWYTSPTFELETYWSFASNIVEKDTILYANWVVYTDPSKIKVTVTSGTELKIHFLQSEAYGVEVKWGDSEFPSTSLIVRPNVSELVHTYTNDGTYTIEVRCIRGTHNLGGNSTSNPIITPATAVKEIEFAWNMAYTTLYALYGSSNLTKVTMSKYMTEIALGMFQNCSGLKTINLPEGLTHINDHAFHGCSGLDGYFIIPSTVISIGQYAFSNCSSLLGFDIPSSVSSIGVYAFGGCSNIRSFPIPMNMTNVPSGMFDSCSSLTEAIIPDTIKTLGDDVFSNCTSLSKVVLINDDLIVGNRCFNNCPNLKTVGPIGQGDYDIEYAWKYVIPNNIFNTASTTDSALEEVVLADTITRIGDSAFAYTTIKHINLPVGLKEIGDLAFYYCNQLNDIEIPSSVTRIGNNAFYRCSAMTYVKIPFVEDGLFIGNKAFEMCFSVSRFDIHAVASLNKITTYADSWFLNCSVLAKLHIPRTILSPEIAYGSAWNYQLSGVQLTYFADLD